MGSQKHQIAVMGHDMRTLEFGPAFADGFDLPTLQRQTGLEFFKLLVVVADFAVGGVIWHGRYDIAGKGKEEGVKKKVSVVGGG